ncbi:hypothetical protein Angca_003481 [Angiostrongylus cantonensis]|nr:hypothetical protein Angca_003481 [Angiostrongylus cantonensis]
MNFFSVIVAIALFGTLFMVHVGLHRKNTCHMTYMWRFISLVPVEVYGNIHREYGLYRYMEGVVNEQTMSISSNDIPVLFVPGSGGSAKQARYGCGSLQVRSVASMLMNKTEMTSAPFRMHFYAADFDEELSFLSGAVLYRQRNFVMKAISVLHKMYSHKIVLIGHSFGGTVLHALPALVDFDVSRMDLVVTLASPLVNPREIFLTFFYFLQYDRLLSHVVHIPSWSIPGVDTSVDHLCILWCNQLIRHSTRILYKYGIAVTKDTFPRSASTFMKSYFQKERNDSRKAAETLLRLPEGITKIGIFDYPWVSRIYTGDLENSKKVFKLEFPSHYVAYLVQLFSDCDASMRFVYSNFYIRSALVDEQTKVRAMIVDLPYGLKPNVGHIFIEGQPQCRFHLTLRPDIFYAWYLLLISEVSLFTRFTLCALMALTIVEKLLGSCEFSFRGECYVGGCFFISMFFCFTYNHWVREYVFAVTVFYTLSCFYFLSKIVSLFMAKMYSSAPSFVRLLNAVLNLVMLTLLPVNLCLTNSMIAFLMTLQRTAGPYAVLLSIFTGSICTVLGYAEPTHDRLIHIIEDLGKMTSLDVASVLSSLLAKIDFSRVLITPVIFHLVARVFTIVRPPHYLVSLKIPFTACLLVVPGFVASQVSLSLEAYSVVASLLLTVLTLL